MPTPSLPNPGKPPPDSPKILLQALADVNLSRFLRDTDMSGRIARRINAETDIPLLGVRLALRLITPVVVSLSETGGKWLGEHGLHRAASFLERSSWCDRILELLKAIKILVQDIKNTADAEQALKDYLGGAAPEGLAQGAEHLSLEVQTGLKTQDDIERLAKELRCSAEELQKSFAQFLNPQPLFRELLPDEERHRFVYRSRSIPFVPRAALLEDLQAFALSGNGSASNFTWQAITGPGGAGKSRLALEFCLDNGGAFRAGILSTLGHDFLTWQPDMPALLVVDYASTDRERLKTILRTLCDRSAELDFPVRMLLLDRDGEGSFFEELGRDHGLLEHRHQPPWVLDDLGDHGLWEIMLHFFYSAASPVSGSREEHLQRLGDIDRLRRPLFAAYYGDAVARGHCRQQCDRQSLISDVITREQENFWKKAGATEADHALVALATMVRGVSTLRTDLPEGVARVADLSDDRFLALGGTSMPLPDEDEGTVQSIMPWEPDLVGELFVLNFLNDRGKLGYRKVALPLIQAAWAMNPLPMAQFIDRAVQDYPDLARAARLLSPPEGKGQKMLWALVAVNCISHLGKAGRPEDAVAVHQKLAALAKAHPGNQGFALEQAKGAFNLLTDFGNAGQLADAQRMYDDLKALALAYPDNAEITLAQAKGAVNCISAYGNAGQLADAQQLYEDLKALAGTWKDNPEIVLRQANGAFNLLTDYGKAGNLTDAQRLYEDLKALAGTWKDNAEISLAQGRGAFNLLNAYSRAKQPAEALRLYDDLKALAGTWKDNPEIALRQANGAFNLLTDYGKAGNLTEAQRLYDDLKALAGTWKDNPEIALRQAKGAVNCIIAYGKAGKLEEAQRLYDDLKALAGTWKDNAEIVLQQAKGAVNCIVFYGKAQQPDLAKAMFKELLALAEAYPNVAAFLERFRQPG